MKTKLGTWNVNGLKRTMGMLFGTMSIFEHFCRRGRIWQDVGCMSYKCFDFDFYRFLWVSFLFNGEREWQTCAALYHADGPPSTGRMGRWGKVHASKLITLVEALKKESRLAAGELLCNITLMMPCAIHPAFRDQFYDLRQHSGVYQI